MGRGDGPSCEPAAHGDEVSARACHQHPLVRRLLEWVRLQAWATQRHCQTTRWTTNLSTKVNMSPRNEHAVVRRLLDGRGSVRTGSWTGPPRGGRAPRVEMGSTAFGIFRTAGRSRTRCSQDCWRVERSGSLSHRCIPILVTFVCELTKETINLPPSCLQGGFQGSGWVGSARRGCERRKRSPPTRGCRDFPRKVLAASYGGIESKRKVMKVVGRRIALGTSPTRPCKQPGCEPLAQACKQHTST